jgi:hypothetical protein
VVGVVANEESVQGVRGVSRERSLGPLRSDHNVSLVSGLPGPNVHKVSVQGVQEQSNPRHKRARSLRPLPVRLIPEQSVPHVLRAPHVLNKENRWSKRQEPCLGARIRGMIKRR